MKNMKVKTKLILGFSIPVILTIINVLVGVLVTNIAVSTISAMNQEGADQIAEGLDRLVTEISQLNEDGATGIRDELATVSGIDENERVVLIDRKSVV